MLVPLVGCVVSWFSHALDGFDPTLIPVRRGFMVALSLSVGGWVPACSEPAETPADGSTGSPAASSSGGATAVASSGPGEDETGMSSCSDPEAAVQQIFMASCLGAGCHGGDAAAGLDLLAEGWPERLIGQPSSSCEGWIRVVPGEPASSFLFDKLSASTACGAPMPVGQSLPPEEIACIEAWISQLGDVSCETCGGEACVDLEADAEHCGACGAACPAGIACQAGSCACPEGTIVCGDACVDPSANGEHCGGCDSPCDPGLVCAAGECSAGCGALTECGGGCVDTSNDALHCGGCDQPCPMGAACVGSSCECPGPDVTYTQDIEPIMVDQCTSMGCHGFPVSQEGLDLREGIGYALLVGMASQQCAGETLVSPGQPDSSYLMNKLLGVDMCSGTRMPKGTPLSGAETDLVASWICKGALE